MTTMDEERREAAIKRIKEKSSFKIQLFIYLVVNTMLIVMWAISHSAITVPPGLPTIFFWPILPIGGWASGWPSTATTCIGATTTQRSRSSEQ